MILFVVPKCVVHFHLQVLLDRASVLVIQDYSSNQQPQAAAGVSFSHSSSQQPQAAAAGGSMSIPLMRPAELASVIYCSSKLRQHRPQLLASAAAALSADLYACSTVELNRCDALRSDIDTGVCSHGGRAWSSMILSSAL